MIKISNKIKKLFYNPTTDSIKILLEDIDAIHDKIIENTDLSKGTLLSKHEDYKTLIQSFNIPEEGLSEKKIATLIADSFEGAPRWHSPRTMFNVAPPTLLQTVASMTLTSLYNPNIVYDTASGEIAIVEQKVIKAISEYIGWNWHESGGSFVFGGKATTLYGVKLGLEKCSKNSSSLGVKEDIIVLSTKVCHPSHPDIGDLLGIGSKNVIRLGVNSESEVDLKEMQKVIEDAVKQGKKIATIIVSGGTTNDMTVDPIKEVVELRDKLVKKLKLDYKPHVHADSVVGFPWIFFKDYDMEKNSLGIDKAAKQKIIKIIKNLRNLHYADSFGADFHKMGFCPYISSLFMVKDKNSYYKGKDSLVKFGRYTPFEYTIENSRPASGPMSAYIALNLLGVKGFQTLIAHHTEIAANLEEALEKTGQFEIINKTGLGSAIMFVPKIPGNPTFNNPEEETHIRNSYVESFIDNLRKLGNPFYIDMVPGYSSGGAKYPYRALKIYVMSPYADRDTNSEFMSFIIDLKKEIDLKFDFNHKSHSSKDSMEYYHPLK
jgi:glutamate/tyrosine decarboxylase-like PLP-dependent enzyme